MSCYGARAALLTVLLTLTPGCGSRHAEAPRGAHPPNDAVAVPYPPPPAKVEEVPAQPNAACVWADGYWDFTDRWEWQSGEWVIPQAHCRLAPVELRRQGGLLLHAGRAGIRTTDHVGAQSACRAPACSQISVKSAVGSGSGQ